MYHTTNSNSSSTLSHLIRLGTSKVDNDYENMVDAVKSDSDVDVDSVAWLQLRETVALGGEFGIKLILCKILNTLSSLMDLQSKTHTIETVKFALSLVNIALEAGGASFRRHGRPRGHHER